MSQLYIYDDAKPYYYMITCWLGEPMYGKTSPTLMFLVNNSPDERSLVISTYYLLIEYQYAY
jgi:hypothetical protein